RLSIRWRPTDDAEDLAGRGLMLQRFRQLARARLHLVEESHILDRDHRLVGKSREQLYLLFAEGPHLGATDQERADGFVLPQQGDAESGPVTETERALAAIGKLIGGTLEVVHVHRLPINEGAPSDPAALDRPLAQN